MNLEQIIAGEEEIYPDECEKSADGAKDNLGRCDGRDFLCKIGVLDGRVQ